MKLKLESNCVFNVFLLLFEISLSGCVHNGSENIMSDSESTKATQTSTDKSSPEDFLTVTQVYQNAVDNGFSGAVLVRHRGAIVLHEASGFANRDLAIPNTIDTVFDIGSITKQFTGALIMALQEAGLLKVGDTLADHFDDVPEDKADITIHQLLTHTAGFDGGFGADTVAIDRDIFLKLAWATRLEFEPGTKHRYSNAGYSIATAIAESVSGQSYESALKTHIFSPAILSETGYLLPDWSNRTLAIGYRDRRSLEEMSSWAKDGPYWNLRGNGGLLSTTSDLLKWHYVLSGESVLTASSIETLQSRHVDKNLRPGRRRGIGRPILWVRLGYPGRSIRRSITLARWWQRIFSCFHRTGH